MAHQEALKASLEQISAHTHTTRVFDRREWVLDHIFDIQRSPDLIEYRPHIANARVGEHDELQLRGCLEVVQLVFACPIRQKLVVLATELANHATQREDGAEYELRVVF